MNSKGLVDIDIFKLVSKFSIKNFEKCYKKDLFFNKTENIIEDTTQELKVIKILV